LLTLAGDFFGVVMGWAANTLTDAVSLRLFLHNGFRNVLMSDFIPSTLKTCVFGTIIGLIGCFQGLHARSATAAVSRAAPSQVVRASVLVILSDVVLVKLMLSIWPMG